MPRILITAFSKRKQTPCVADSQQCVFADVQRHRAVSVDRLTPLLPCLLVALLFTMLPSFAHAQAYERMYPDHDVAKARATIHWNGDTVFIPSWDGLIMRSVDAGRTWEDLRPAGRNWCFYNSAKTSHGIFLLGEPTFWADTSLAPGHLAALLKYDPWKNSLDIVSIPVLPGSYSNTSNYVNYYEITARNDALFLSQAGARPGTSIHRSMDGGKNWDPIPLPDSSYVPMKSPLTCFDSTHLAANFHTVLQITTDAGATWNAKAGLMPSTSELFRANYDWLSADEFVTNTKDGDIKRTTDGGDTWTHLCYPPFQQVRQFIATSGGRGYVLAEQKLYRTDDGFSTFINLLPDEYFSYISVQGRDTIVATQDNDNISISHDGGVSWEISRRNPLFIETMRMASADHGVIYVKDYDSGTNGYYRTSDGWRTMEYVMDEEAPGFLTCLIHPITNTLWYRVQSTVGESVPIVTRSTDAGKTWTEALRRSDLPDLRLDKGIDVVTITDTNYVGMIIEKKLYYSSDQGEQWNTLPLPVTGDDNYRIHLSPGKASWLMIKKPRGRTEADIDSVLYSSGDWTQWQAALVEPDSFSYKYSYFHALHVTESGKVYIHAEKYRDGGNLDYVLHSDDNGQTWGAWPGARGTRFDSYRPIIYFDDGSSISNTTSTGRLGRSTAGTELRRSIDGWKTSYVEDYRYLGTSAETLVKAGKSTVYLKGYDTILRNSGSGVNSVRERPAVLSALSVGSPYPHPVVRGGVSYIPIEFGTTTNRVLRVTLANMLGQTIQNIAFTASEAVSTEVRWLVPGIAPGVYILRVQAGDAVTVRPVVVNR
jgi:hypothetical protein